MDNKKIGLFIVELRKEKGLTQYELAELIPISREAVSKWERGITCPDQINLLKLSEIFNVSVTELLYGERKNNGNSFEIDQLPVNLYNNQNKLKRKLKIAISLLIICLIAFLLYYFISNFNSLKVYNIDCLDEDISITDGLMVMTREKIYFNLGTISTSENINYLKLYYINDEEKNFIISSDSKTLSFVDYSGYSEYFDFKNLEEIINNLYLEINYENEVKNIKLIVSKNFSNDYIFAEKKQNISKDNNIMEYDASEMESNIKKTFTYQDGIYTYEEDNHIYTYIEDAKILNLIITDESYTFEWNFNIISNDLEFFEYKEDEILNSFNYVDGNINCNVDTCENEEKIIDYFYNKLENIFTK